MDRFTLPEIVEKVTEARWFRKYFVPGAAAVGALMTLNWLVSPSEATLVAEGRDLFSHEWQVNDPLCGDGDGLGPVFNEKSCVACHFQGGVGGAGGVEQNVDSFEVLPSDDFALVRSGVIHKFATDESLKESMDNVKRQFPVIPDGVIVDTGCGTNHAPLDPVQTTSINTPALFGVGLIDEISSTAIKAHNAKRSFGKATQEFNLEFQHTPVGRVRKLGLTSVGRFGWKGQFSSLREFVASACAVELGLTNRMRAQDKPQMHVPDDEAEYDMTNRQLDALVAFCRNLPRPEQVMPTDSVERYQVQNGEHQFKAIGCADCHTPDIGGVEQVYSDFALYSLEPQSSVVGHSGGYETRELKHPIPENHTKLNEWQTPPLWGVADSAPYFHDGLSPTLESAIERHAGQAAGVTQKYQKLNESDRRDIVMFLKSLRAPLMAERTEVTQNLESQMPVVSESERYVELISESQR